MRGGAEPREAAAALMAHRARPRYAGGREESTGQPRLHVRALLRHASPAARQEAGLAATTFIIKKQSVDHLLLPFSSRSRSFRPGTTTAL